MSEIEFNIDFNRELTETEQLEFWEDFINTIEALNIYYGGGNNSSYFKGYLDLSKSNFSTNQALELIEKFTDKYSEAIKNIESNSLF